MTTTLEQAIQARCQEPHPLVFSLSWQDQILWIKTAPPKKHRWVHQLQQMAAMLLRQPLLASTAHQGGREALRREALRYQNWQQAGLPAAKLITATDQYLVTEDTGPTIPEWIQKHKPNPEILEQLFTALQDSLAHIHNHPQVHGMPRLRNAGLTQHDKAFEITWFDLEESPLERMSLAEAQARDLLFLLWDISLYPSINAKDWLKAYQEKTAGGAKALKALNHLMTTYRRFIYPWAKCLESKGKDLKRFHCVLKNLQKD